MLTANNQNKINKTDLVYLLFRPGEPLYYPKGAGELTCYFNVGPKFFIKDYKNKATQILSRFGSDQNPGRRININSLLTDALTKIPLDKVTVINRRELFSILIPKHAAAAGELIKIFLGLRNQEDLLVFAAYARDRVNPVLFAYAFSCALLHREDTRNLRLPSIAEMFPQKFINCGAIEIARERANIFDNPDDRTAVEITPDLTGNDSDPEHLLSYFREDIGINLHHWHWHLVYPFSGPENIVRKDRRGELFYYMHQQVMARYNTERLCNRLDLAVRLLDWNEPLKEAYFPMLYTSVAGRSWPGRPANLRLSNINRSDNQLAFDIEDMKRWKDNIHQAILKGEVTVPNSPAIKLNNESGIDILGNMVEASDVLSPNPNFYGSIHNRGHMAIAYIHDPENKYAQPPGVMSESNTAMRDPIFYRWHAFINDIFVEHKNTLPPYDSSALGFQQVRLTSLEICPINNDNSNNNQLLCTKQNNILETFMKQTDVDMSWGLDFFPRGAILARITHLDHNPFNYRLTVFSESRSQIRVTVRIFLGPAKNFANNDMPLVDQKNLMIEMDRFTVYLKAGDNRIIRRSTESSVTIPFEQTFRNLNIPANTELSERERFYFCGCGWPNHMLIPKGTQSGFPMDLFAMITNYEDDRVDQVPLPEQTQQNQQPQQNQRNECKPAMSFCGLRDRRYPDRRPMGFPFDRPLPTGVQTLENFIGNHTNMAVTRVTVTHSPTLAQGNLTATNVVPARDVINSVPTQVTLPNSQQNVTLTSNNDESNNVVEG